MNMIHHNINTPRINILWEEDQNRQNRSQSILDITESTIKQNKRRQKNDGGEGGGRGGNFSSPVFLYPLVFNESPWKIKKVHKV